MTPRIWAVLPAAGRGTRFGGDVPKQYLALHGVPLLAHALDALLAEPRMVGAVVALAPDDAHWPGWTERCGKPVRTCVGGAERAASVRAALALIDDDDALVLVHDAARPCVATSDVSRLIDAALAQADGALLAAPVRDTLKRAMPDGRSSGTVPRDGLWRALTPQAFRAGPLRRALDACHASGIVATDEAMAMEATGARPRLVEGREDNLKVTTPADLALAAAILAGERA